MANNETKVLKNNTLEQWRQKTNEVSYHLGDVDQLDNRLTDKVYTYSSTSESVFSVYDADASSKNLRFEIKPEETIDAVATIIMTGNPTIPSSFVSDVVLFQGSSGSETFTGTINYINQNKISLRNTTGTFNASAPIKFSTDSIASTKLVRLVTESYKVGYVKAVQDGSTLSQSLTQSGFHIPNLSLRVVLTGSPSIPASFTEGAVVTQANGFSGVLYKATTSEILFKSHSGSFSVSAFAGIPHTDASNRIAAANLSSQATPDNTLGNIIELHTIPTSDTVVLTSTNTIDAITEIQDDIGEITSLGTTDKSDIVSSINEIETASRGSNSDYTLTTTAQNFRDAIREHETDIGNMTLTGLSATDISAALRELRTELGNHASLGTTHTGDAVGAINELETAVRGSAGNYTIGTNANDLVAAINEIETVLRAGNSDYALTTSAQNVRDAIREHETDIGNMTFTGLSATDISAAIRELRTELGNHATIDDAAGYSATDASAGIVEIQGAIGNYNNLTTSATNLTLAINELDLKQGAAALGTDATTLSGAINELETAARGTKANYTLGTGAQNFRDAINELETAIRGTLGNYTLTTSANNLVGAINEHETQINTLDTNHLNKNLAAGVNQNITGSVTFTGDSVDFSNTTALFSSAGGVANFGSAFVNLNATAASGSNVNIQGLQVDRTSLSTSNPKHDVRLIWNETLVGSKPARAWQLRGMADDKSDTTADIVTFYNAKDLIANNTESGIVVDWDSTNQNFDFNIIDHKITFTGDVTGTGVIYDSDTLTSDQLTESIALTIQPNSVALGTDTTGNYIASVVGTANEVTVSGNTGDDGRSITVGLPNSVAISGEMEAGSLDINGNADISGNLVTHGTLNVNGNTTLGNASNDTVSIPGSLTITGDLTVNGTNTTLNTATLEVEDTLVLVGSNLSSEPTTGGFGLETKQFSGGTHSNAASNVTGSHSLVYNFGTDRWEADGSLILSEATLGSPDVKVDNTSLGDLLASRSIDFIDGSGTNAVGSYDSSTQDFNIKFDNTDKGSDQAIYKNITADVEGTSGGGATAAANINNDTLTIAGGNAITTSRIDDTITIAHDDTSTLAAQAHGGNDNGIVIEDITVDANGHVTDIGTRDLDSRFVQESETAQGAVTANKVVRTNNNGTITATGFTGPLSGDVTGDVKSTNGTAILDNGSDGSDAVFTGSVTGNSSSSTEVYVSEANTDETFRRLVWHTGDGTGNKSLHHSDNLLYKASTDTLHAGTFEGNLSGTATNANALYLTAQNGSDAAWSNNYPIAWFGAGGGAHRSAYEDDSLTYNPHTNTLTVTNLAGNASSASQVFVSHEPLNSNNTRYLTFFGTNSDANKALKYETSLNYNPHTNVLTAVTFSGSLSGNASSASQVYVTNGGVAAADSANFRVPYLIDTANDSGNKSLEKNSAFYYNPYQNRLTASLNGTADHATEIQSTLKTTQNTTYYIQFAETAATGQKNLAHDANLYFNASSNSLTVPTVVSSTAGPTTGSGTTPRVLTGASGTGDHTLRGFTAAAVRAFLNVSSGANNFSLPFSYGSANNGNYVVQRDANGDFSARIITAATTSLRVTPTQTAGTYNLLFTSSNSGTGTTSDTIYRDSGLSYNPSTNKLGGSASIFKGDLEGNASSATSATSATNATYASQVYVTNTNSNATYYLMGSGTNSSANKAPVYTSGCYYNASNNSIYATGDVIAAASDDRLKDKKGNIENALEKVNSLNGFHYNWNDKAVELGFRTEEQKEEKHIGLSAQDVQKVAPELVTESSLEGYDTVRYDKVTALLVEAVKELTEQNKELKAEIESLKSINS